MPNTLTIKAGICILFIVLFGNHLIYENWEGILVCFAAILLVPIGVDLLFEKKIYRQIISIVALLLLPAYAFHPTISSQLLILPYCLFTFFLAVIYTIDFFNKKKYFKFENWLPLFALGYLAVGIGWLFCFIFEIKPLNFNPTIVGLTAAHFHLAGFVLTFHTWKLIQQKSVRNKGILKVAPLLGMPLVATGITLTKLGFDAKIEMVGSFLFIVFVLVLIWEQFRFAKTQKGVQKLLFQISAATLLFTMILAMFYAIRSVFPHPFFTIPNMKIWYGTLNVFGFGLCALLGWKRSASSKPSDRL